MEAAGEDGEETPSPPHNPDRKPFQNTLRHNMLGVLLAGAVCCVLRWLTRSPPSRHSTIWQVDADAAVRADGGARLHAGTAVVRTDGDT